MLSRALSTVISFSLPKLLAIAVLSALPVDAYAQISPNSFMAGIRYDVVRRVTGTISPDPDGSGALRYAATRNTYDADGRLSKVETGQLSTWQSESVAPASWSGFTIYMTKNYSYDVAGQKIKVTYVANGGTQKVYQYTYDNMGRLDCKVQRMNPAAFGSLPASACSLGTAGTGANAFGEDRITKTSYDAAGRVVTVTKAYATPLEQDYAAYTYSLNDQQLSVTDAKGNRTGYTYDGYDRKRRWIFPSKTNTGQVDTNDYEEYSYFSTGNMSNLRKRDGNNIGYTYDSLNRMSVKNVPGSSKDVYYGYDLRGLQLYARFGSTSGQGITNTYDKLGRLATTTTSMGGTSRQLSYQYDSNSNRTRVTHPDGAYFVYSYDGLDRMTGILLSGQTTIASFSYNSKGQRASLTGAVSTSYGYDDLGRATDLDHNLYASNYDVQFDYDYSPASQLTSEAVSNNAFSWSGEVLGDTSYTTNGLNQYSNVGGAPLTYDANGNLKTDGAGTTFNYDTENRMTSAVGTKTLTMEYDPLGRLYRTSGSGATDTRFLYDGDALVAEYSSSGAVLKRYVHGSGIDEPLVWFEGSSTSASARRVLRSNRQGSIVAVTNASGVLVHANTYSTYGKKSGTNGGRFQYTGQIDIPELDLYYYKARLYSPELGRFLQTDPIGYEDQMNLYAYVHNDPVNMVDPSGEFGVLGAAIGGGLDFALQYRALTSQGYSPEQALRRIDYISVATSTALGSIGGFGAGLVKIGLTGKATVQVIGYGSQTFDGFKKAERIGLVVTGVSFGSVSGAAKAAKAENRLGVGTIGGAINSLTAPIPSGTMIEMTTNEILDSIDGLLEEFSDDSESEEAYSEITSDVENKFLAGMVSSRGLGTDAKDW